MPAPLTRPTGMQLQDWADAAVQDLSAYGLLGKLQGDDWQQWAAQLSNIPSLGAPIPDPTQFEHWQDWAERLCGVLA